MREATEADSVEASTKRLPKFSQAKRQKDSDSERADWSVMLFMLLLSGCFLLHTLQVVGLSYIGPVFMYRLNVYSTWENHVLGLATP